MEAVLRDLCTKQGTQVDRVEFALELFEQKVADQELSFRKKFSEPSKQDPTISKSRLKLGKQPSKKVFDERVESFRSDASRVPGFENLEQAKNSGETICWLLVLFVLVGLTGYSFFLLFVDYMENPTRTNVRMSHSKTIVPAATLCVPLLIDKTPYVKAKNSAFENFSWKETAHTLMSLLANEQNLTFLFQCQHFGDELQDVDNEDVQVRLVNEKGRKNNEYGRVEIKLNGVWGAVCRNQWDKREAQVVCRMITGKTNQNATTLHPIQGGQGPDVVWMDNVDCSGSEQNLGHCKHQGWGDSDCAQSEYAAVDCTGTANPDPWKEDAAEESNATAKVDIENLDLDVRLRKENGAITKKVGTVEVSYHGVWGMINDELWGENEAMVICRMLGWPEGTGTAFSGSGSGTQGPTWLTNVQCLGNETSLNDCIYEVTSDKHSPKAAVDCTGKAERNIRLSEDMRSLSFGRTTAALLSRLTAFETLRINSGETPSSFKWSTGPQYTAGNFHKELAMETLLTIMSKGGHPGDLRLMQDVLACAMCQSLALNVHLQRDKFSKRKQKVFDCNEVTISWIEDSISARTVCFKLPLGKKIEDVQKGFLALSLDIGLIYDNDWSNSTVREFFSNNFKLDFSDSINAERATAETLELSPGEEQTVIVDTVAAYNMEVETDCAPDVVNCELKCFAMEYQKPCIHLCTPFTWENLTYADQPEAPYRPYCLLEDYHQCYQEDADVAAIQPKCSELCKQPCHQEMYAVRTLFKKPLPGKSETKLFVKLDSQVYPEFTENRAVTWYGLMGDLGGVLGLWLGASLTGVLHFAWFFLCDVLCTKRKLKKQKQAMAANDVEIKETELNGTYEST